MRVVVTGASGLVGRHIVSAAKAIGLDILAVSRASGDALTDDAYADMPKGDVLVHLAQPAAPNAIDSNAVASAVATFARLLEREWIGVVYASSVAVYGRFNGHLPETKPVFGAVPYAVMKLDCEALCLEHGGTALRLANVLASEPAPGTVMADILAQVPGSGPITVRNADAKLDLIWIDDVTAAFLAAIDRRAHGLFNLASGRAHSVRDIANAALAGANEIDRQIVSRMPVSPQSDFHIDISRIRAALDWAPRHNALEEISRLARERTEKGQ